MAEEAGSEAITVVIEKLTEIVESTQPNEESADRTNLTSIQLVQGNETSNPPLTKVDPRFSPGYEETAFTTGDQNQQPEESQSSEVGQTEDKKGFKRKHDEKPVQLSNKEKDNQPTQQIVINLPQGIPNLTSADPQTLLQTLIQMTSNQVLESPTHFIQSHGQVPQNGEVVESIGAEMIIPTTTLFAENPETMDGNQNCTRVVDVAALPSQTLQSLQQVPESGKVQVKTNSACSNGGKKELLKCEKCDYCSHNKHYLKQHVDLVHNADRPFKCPFCDYAGKRSHSLKEHLVVHSTNRPFECPICNASFRKKGHLTNHIRLHNTLKYFECSICQEKFKDRSVLYSHLRTSHEPSQVYECKVCDYATTVKSNIVMHMHTHGNPEVYRCNICSFTALHINILKQHMQTHSANNVNLYKVEKPSLKARPVIFLKCSVCGYTTDKKDALQNHMWQHLPEETTKEAMSASKDVNSEESKSIGKQGKEDSDQGSVYKCTECSYSCKEAYLFITHMLAHHPRQKLIADQQKQQQQEQQQKQQESDTKQRQQDGKEPPVAFTHDSAAGVYRCTICGYLCEQQRTIKAHIWKHSGHKDIDYPMFQNGPISVYDETPVGKPVLLSEKSKKPPIKVIPRPKEEDSGIEEQNDASQVTDSDGQAQNSADEEVKSSIELKGKEDTGPLTASEKGKIQPLDIPSAVKASPKQNQIAVSSQMETKILRPILPNQPIKWTLQQVDSIPTLLPVGVHSQLPSPVGPGVRLLTPLAPSARVQPVTTPKLLPAATSPEIVRLILGSDQNVCQNKSASDTEENLSKRKISVEQSNDKDALVGVAKRLCMEEVGTSLSTGNVVVQQVPEIYSTPALSLPSNYVSHLQPQESVLIAQSPQPQHESIEPADKVQHQNSGEHEDCIADGPTNVEPAQTAVIDEAEILDDDRESLMVTEVVIETRIVEEEDMSNEGDEIIDVEREDNLTLVDLLKKGPNHNPVCPGSAGDVEEQIKSVIDASGMDTDPSDADSETTHSEENKRKKGICSSLLAVIEQLRERSKSENDGEVKADGSDKTKFEKSIKTGSKRKSRRGSAEDDTPIDQYKNVERMTTNPVSYRCKLCHYTSNVTSVIKNHMRLHKTKQPFECSLCDHQASSSESLQEHMLQHCKVRTYHCKVCTSVFNYKSQLRAHMRAHNEKEPFLCDLCDYETSNPIAFRNHGRVHVEKKDEPGVSAEVASGDKSANTDSGTDIQKDFVCDECDYEADSTSDLMLHIRDKHPVTYKCDQCEQQCSTWSAFSTHLKMHLELRTLKCELCDFVATSTRSLKSHMKRHVNDQRFVQQPLEQYKCNLCGYVCHHLPSLKSHMWRHASDKNYSYQITNDVINAAIDFDTNPTLQSTTTSNDVSSAKDSVEVTSSTDGIFDKEQASSPMSSTVTSLPASQQLPQEGLLALKDAKSSERPCLVTFRCCQCGFESLDKSVLNDHMKTHLDIIRKTLEVNKSRLVARAMKEIGHSADKENSNVSCENHK